MPCIVKLHQTRLLLYVTQVLSEDEETQKQGFVTLAWPLKPSLLKKQQSSAVISAFPIRVTAFHVCLEDNIGANVALRLLDVLPQVKMRAKIHVGECITKKKDLSKDVSSPMNSLIGCVVFY